MVDASGGSGDEGRGQAAISPGEALTAIDPGIPEWDNLGRQNLLTLVFFMSGGPHERSEWGAQS